MLPPFSILFIAYAKKKNRATNLPMIHIEKDCKKKTVFDFNRAGHQKLDENT